MKEPTLQELAKRMRKLAKEGKVSHLKANVRCRSVKLKY